MNVEQRIASHVDDYRARGFRVISNPKPDELPNFAKNFKVEILGVRDDVSVLVSSKQDQVDLTNDAELLRHIEITERQPGWRYEVILLDPKAEPLCDRRPFMEMPESEYEQLVDEVERLRQAGFERQGFIMAWTVLEVAIRRFQWIDRQGFSFDATLERLVGQLYASGPLTIETHRRLATLLDLRASIIHGYSPFPLTPDDTQFLLDTAQEALAEAATLAQPAASAS